MIRIFIRVLAAVFVLNALVARPAAGDTAVTTANLNVRTCPSVGRGCPVLVTVPRGRTLFVLKRDGEWIRVAVDGHEGWVFGRYTKPIAHRIAINREGEMSFGGMRIVPPWAVRQTEMRFAVLPFTAHGFLRLVTILSILASVAFYLGVAALLGGPLGMDPRLIMVIGVIMAAIVAVGGAAVLSYMVAILTFGFVGTLVGGMAFGAGVREGSGAAIITGALSSFLFVVSFFSPMVIELRLVIALLLAIDALLASYTLSELVSDGPDFFNIVFNPVFIVINALGGFLVLPVIAPQWLFVQPGIFLLGLLGGVGRIAGSSGPRI